MQPNPFFTVRTLLILLAFQILMTFLINGSPFGVAKLKEITGGPSILDMEMGYTSERAYQVLDALGEQGRAFDLKYIVPLDFPFPLAYGLFFFVTITVMVQTLFPKLRRPWLAGVTGLLAMLFDWLENIVIIILLLKFPARLEGIVGMGSAFTQLKWVFNGGSVVLILGGLVGLGIRKLNGNRNPGDDARV